jgi:hypothetical protein
MMKTAVLVVLTISILGAVGVATAIMNSPTPAHAMCHIYVPVAVLDQATPTVG